MELAGRGITQRLTQAMDRYADGEVAAFGEIYDLLKDRLLGFFVRRSGDRAWAEDLTQHTLLQIHRARHCFIRGSDATPWVFAIARRLFIDGLRRRSRDVLMQSTPDEGAVLQRPASAASNPEAVASSMQLAAEVDATLGELPDAQRWAYQLVYLDGLNLSQAAEVMGTTSTALKQRLYRTHKTLRDRLGIRYSENVEPSEG